MKKVLALFKDNFALITLLYIACGIIKNSLYYRFFNIQITSFLEISEIFTLFAEDSIIMVSIILFIIIGVSIGVVFENGANSDDTVFSLASKRKLSKNFNLIIPLRIISHYINSPATTMFSVGILLALLPFLGAFVEPKISDLLGFEEDVYNRSLLLCFILCLNFSLLVVPIYYESVRLNFLNKHKFEPTASAGVFVLVMPVIIMFSILTYYDINTVIKEGKYFGTMITLDNGTKINSTPRGYFIGKTNKYIFYFQIDSTQTYVYPIERVKSISFTDGWYYKNK